VALPVFAVSLAAFFGFAALAVDLGMLYTAQTQAQRAADSAALAGAGWLLTSPGDTANARLEAEVFAERHEVMGDSIDIDPAQDVEFESDTLVRVFVLRTDARANPVTTYFARALGIIDADVGVKAAAIVDVGGPVEQCLFPFIPPDAWQEQPSGQRSSDIYFSDFNNAPVYQTGDIYAAPPVLGAGYPAYTGWGALTADQGKYLIAKAGGGGNWATAGHWWPMNNPPSQQGGGMSQLRDAIRGMCNTPYTLGQGDPANIQTGFGGNAIRSELQATLAWGPSTPAAALACYQNAASCPDLRRIRTMPLYDPRFIPGPGGSQAATVGNFARVWLAGFCDQAPQASSPACSALSGAGGKNSDKATSFAVMYLGPTSSYAAGTGGPASAGVLALRLVE
jgi:hypothetical protein